MNSDILRNYKIPKYLSNEAYDNIGKFVSTVLISCVPEVGVRSRLKFKKKIVYLNIFFSLYLMVLMIKMSLYIYIYRYTYTFFILCVNFIYHSTVLVIKCC